MPTTTARQRVLVATLVLVLAIAAVVYAAGRASGSRVLSPADLVGTKAPVGKVVTLEGTVRSFSAEGCVLESREGATVARVTFSERQTRRRFGQGVLVIVSGRVVRAGVLEDARLVAPTGPSKYEGDGVESSR